MVFKINPNGREAVLHTFGRKGDDRQPYCGVVMDGAGNLYGTTYGGGAHADGTVFKLDSSGKETILYSLRERPTAAHPQAGAVLDSSGNIYGTAQGRARQEGVILQIKP